MGFLGKIFGRSRQAQPSSDLAEPIKALEGLRQVPFLLFAVVARSEALVERRGRQVAWSVGRVGRKAEVWQTVMIDGAGDQVLQLICHAALSVTQSEGSRYYEQVEEALVDVLDPDFDDGDLRPAAQRLRTVCDGLGDCYATVHEALVARLREVADVWEADRTDDEIMRMRQQQQRDLLMIERIFSP